MPRAAHGVSTGNLERVWPREEMQTSEGAVKMDPKHAASEGRETLETALHFVTGDETPNDVNAKGRQWVESEADAKVRARLRACHSILRSHSMVTRRWRSRIRSVRNTRMSFTPVCEGSA